MTKRHLFSLNSPANWPIERKNLVWVTRPNPGPHPLLRCLPLGLLIKNVLNHARNLREIKFILNQGEILIDNVVRKNQRFPVGIMDVIHVKKTGENFRLIINENNKYHLHKLSKENANLKPCKIIGKKILKKGKIQLNLFDGRNVIVNNSSYKVGDTVMFNLENNKIVDHLKLEKGSHVYITQGKYVGYFGKLEEVLPGKGFQSNKIVFTKDGNKFETLKNYIFVIPQELFK